MSESIEYKGYQIKISQDDSPLNPREDWDCNLGTIVCFHRRYDLGDKNHGFRSRDYSGWDELEKALREEHDAAMILPIYMMDHSGLSFRTGPAEFRACDPQGWDWGRVGLIYTTHKRIKEIWGDQEKTDEEIESFLKAEVETYAQYVTGDVYYYEVTDPDGEELHSCGGYFGSDHEASGLLESAHSEIDGDIQHKLKTEGEQQELILEV